MTETITWIPIWERYPDTPRFVLAVNEEGNISIDVWSGWIQSFRDSSVTHWAEMPKGPSDV